MAAAAGPVHTISSALTGLVSFMSTRPGALVPVAAAATDPADTRAAAFLAAYGGAFGIAGPAWGRVERVTGPDDLGMERVRYRQLHAGIPVTAGEMSIHLKGASCRRRRTPRPWSSRTRSTRRRPSARRRPRPGRRHSWTSTSPAWRRATRSRGSRCSTAVSSKARQTPTRLAWFIEAKGDDLWQYIWIDAHTGLRLLNFSQMPHALSRQVFDANNTANLPGTLLRSEGDHGPVGEHRGQHRLRLRRRHLQLLSLPARARQHRRTRRVPMISPFALFCSRPQCPYAERVLERHADGLRRRLRDGRRRRRPRADAWGDPVLRQPLLLHAVRRAERVLLGHLRRDGRSAERAGNDTARSALAGGRGHPAPSAT